MVVADARLVARDGARRVDAPDEAGVRQDVEDVVDGLLGDAEVRADAAGDRRRVGVVERADGREHRDARAGAPLSRLLSPAVLPPVAGLLRRGGWAALGGAGLLLGAVGLMVLVGQRMPVLLTVLGLFVAALLLPALRLPVLAACAGAGLLLAASSVVSPPAYYRLVTKFSAQMESFPDSHYGRIAARAVQGTGA